MKVDLLIKDIEESQAKFIQDGVILMTGGIIDVKIIYKLEDKK